MTEHNLIYYPYASYTNVQLLPLKLATLYFDKSYIHDPVGASWDTIGTDYHAQKAVEPLMDEKIAILQTVMPADVLRRYAGPITDTIHRDMHDQERLDLHKAQGCHGDLRCETVARPAAREP